MMEPYGKLTGEICEELRSALDSGGFITDDADVLDN